METCFAEWGDSRLPESLQGKPQKQIVQVRLFRQAQEARLPSRRPSRRLQKNHAVENDSRLLQLLSPLFGFMHFIACRFKDPIKFNIG